jgi:hypothetical protein
VHLGAGQVELLGDEPDGPGVDVPELLLERVEDRQERPTTAGVLRDDPGRELV